MYSNVLMSGGTWATASFVLALALTFANDIHALRNPIVNRTCAAAALLGILLLLYEQPAAGILSVLLLVALLTLPQGATTGP